MTIGFPLMMVGLLGLWITIHMLYWAGCILDGPRTATLYWLKWEQFVAAVRRIPSEESLKAQELQTCQAAQKYNTPNAP